MNHPITTATITNISTFSFPKLKRSQFILEEGQSINFSTLLHYPCSPSAISTIGTLSHAKVTGICRSQPTPTGV
jgi:hypothetical protein